jgi:hypothetical protein
MRKRVGLCIKDTIYHPNWVVSHFNFFVNVSAVERERIPGPDIDLPHPFSFLSLSCPHFRSYTFRF